MDAAFPDSCVEGSSQLISSVILPDESDRHVVAAAIKSKTELIVTFNIKDFPLESISPFDIGVQTPDDFLVNIFDFDPVLFMNAFNNQVRRLINPSLTGIQVLQNLEKCGLRMIVYKLKTKQAYKLF